MASVAQGQQGQQGLNNGPNPLPSGISREQIHQAYEVSVCPARREGWCFLPTRQGLPTPSFALLLLIS